MSKKKIWNICYVVGNPKIFSKVTEDAGNPMTRSEAIEGAEAIAGNKWRVWVERADTKERIFESDVEKAYRESSAEE